MADMVRKIGIVTIIDYTNYGNRLQNYAVQTILRGLGFECETIVNFPNAANERGKVWARADDVKTRLKVRQGRMGRLAVRLKAGGLTDVLRDVAGTLRRRIAPNKAELAARTLAELKLRKAASIRAFTRENIRETGFVMYRDSPADHLDAIYDHFVVGSDQVWNPFFRRLAPIDFLPFARPDKRVAFSASIGVSEVPQEHRALYRDGLSGFAHISVREDAAAAIVHDLTGRHVPVTVDPTLLVAAADWSALAAAHPLRPDAPYLLTYFIGERTPACQKLIDDYVTRDGLQIIHLNDPAEPGLYVADPAEFLGFVERAAVFFTDSFHGAIFSVLLDTPFLTFARIDGNANMSSRMDTLLRTLRLEHRGFQGSLTDEERAALLVTDYAHTAPIIVQKRAEAAAYLAEALAPAKAETESV